MDIRYYEQALDRDLTEIVVIARQDGRWLLCRPGGEEPWRFPAGPRKPGEDVHESARRLLWELTGTTDAQVEAVAAYGLHPEGEEPVYGALFFAEIRERESRVGGEARLCEGLSQLSDAGALQTELAGKVQRWLDDGNFRSEEDDLFELLC